MIDLSSADDKQARCSAAKIQRRNHRGSIARGEWKGDIACSVLIAGLISYRMHALVRGGGLVSRIGGVGYGWCMPYGQKGQLLIGSRAHHLY